MKPAQVARPTLLPAFANPSGIIVSASMVRMAPAAKAWVTAIVLGGAPPSSPNPTAADAADSNATPSHSPRIHRGECPALRSPVAADSDSGTLDRNTAATTATPTPPPPSSDAPMATDSGNAVQHRTEHDRPGRPASLLATGALAVPRATLVQDQVASVERECTGHQARHHRQRARGVECLLDQLEGHGADQHSGAEGHHHPHHPRWCLPDQPEARADQQREPPDETPERCFPHAVIDAHPDPKRTPKLSRRRHLLRQVCPVRQRIAH